MSSTSTSTTPRASSSGRGSGNTSDHSSRVPGASEELDHGLDEPIAHRGIIKTLTVEWRQRPQRQEAYLESDIQARSSHRQTQQSGLRGRSASVKSNAGANRESRQCRRHSPRLETAQERHPRRRAETVGRLLTRAVSGGKHR